MLVNESIPRYQTYQSYHGASDLTYPVCQWSQSLTSTWHRRSIVRACVRTFNVTTYNTIARTSMYVISTCSHGSRSRYACVVHFLNLEKPSHDSPSLSRLANPNRCAFVVHFLNLAKPSHDSPSLPRIANPNCCAFVVHFLNPEKPRHESPHPSRLANPNRCASVVHFLNLQKPHHHSLHPLR